MTKVPEGSTKLRTYDLIAGLKTCRTSQDLESVKKIHAEAVGYGLESDVLLGSKLVDVYAKCGSIVAARHVFENMPHRNVVTWTAMILGYALVEEGEVALELYARMQQENVEPNNRTLVAALKACSSLVAVEQGNMCDRTVQKSWSLEQVRAIHSDIWRMKLESDVFVSTTLLGLYIQCGSLADARLVFDYLPQRDVVSWTAMILGYAQMEQGRVALQLYESMQQEGILPDNRAFVGALQALSGLAALEDGCEINRLLVKRECLERVKAVHWHVLQNGIELDLFVGTMLVDAYVKSGSVWDARHVFEQMPYRDVVSWTALISGYSQTEESEVALQLYSRMQQAGEVPNDRTYVSVLKACSTMMALDKGYQDHGALVKDRCLQRVRAIHSCIVKAGLASDVYVGSTLVDVYGKCGSLVDAKIVFEKMPQRNVVSWNAMILGYVETAENKVALDMYTWMQQEAVLPDYLTFVGVLKACGAVAVEAGNRAEQVAENLRLDEVRTIHLDIVKAGFETHILVGTMLVDVYARCGSLVDARHVFEKMPYHDAVSWTAMISGYAQMGEGEVALQMFERMQHEGVVPSGRTYLGALKACATVAGLEKGKEIHVQICREGLAASDIFVANALIDMYCRCGSMVDAHVLFDSRSTRDVVSWNALIAGYSRQGSSDEVFSLFRSMVEEGLQPDEITFVSVLSVCSHEGLVEEGEKYFEVMTREYGIRPTRDHFTCMAGLLGRAGQVDKAMAIVKNMPFQPDTAIWRTVLDACRKWSNVELGRYAFECAVKLNSDEASSYVSMANIYAAAQMWEQAKEIQEMRLKTGATKMPGKSWWTDSAGIVHAFVAGDDTLHSNTRLTDFTSKLVAKLQTHPCSDVIADVLRDRSRNSGQLSQLQCSVSGLPVQQRCCVTRVQVRVAVCGSKVIKSRSSCPLLRHTRMSRVLAIKHDIHIPWHSIV